MRRLLLALCLTPPGFIRNQSKHKYLRRDRTGALPCGNGFRLLLGSKEKTAATWKKITAQVDQRSEKIADDLLFLKADNSSSGDKRSH